MKLIKMRVFTTVEEAYEEMKRMLKEMGIGYYSKTYQDKDVSDDEKFLTKELWAVNIKITEPTSREKAIETYDLSRKYRKQEFEDRISNAYLNPGKSWKYRKDVWEKFLEDDGRFSYTYNERIRHSLTRVIEELKDKPQTRQAVIPIFWRKDVHNAGGKARIPCSMFYQFLIRNDRLHVIYVMRSVDIDTHMLYDWTIAMDIQEYIAEKIGVEVGTFNFFAGSAHAFARDLEEVF